jgi:hypothetical protein
VGVLYSVFPLDDEIATYVRDTGGSVPRFKRSSRHPTPAEIRAACDALPKQRTEYNVNPTGVWQAMVQGANDPDTEPWTLLNVQEFSGSEDEPHRIWFEKGWPSLILEIVRRLAGPCGPLVIVADTGAAPLVVSHSDSTEELFATWEHTRGATDTE